MWISRCLCFENLRVIVEKTFPTTLLMYSMPVTLKHLQGLWVSVRLKIRIQNEDLGVPGVRSCLSGASQRSRSRSSRHILSIMKWKYISYSEAPDTFFFSTFSKNTAIESYDAQCQTDYLWVTDKDGINFRICNGRYGLWSSWTLLNYAIHTDHF